MAGTVTVKDVAREAQVSIGTVSRVLNNHANVTDEMRQRVLKAATELGYFRTAPQEPRTSDNTRTVKEIAFLFCSRTPISISTNPFFSYILQGVEGEASRAGIKVSYRSISEMQDDPGMLRTTLYEMKPGGILLVGPAETGTVRVIQDMQIPMILVDNYVPGTHAIVGDNLAGAREAVEYLIKMGHKQIALLDGPEDDGTTNEKKQIYTIEQRAEGYMLALIKAYLPILDELHENGDLSIEGGYQACRRLVEKGEKFSAIFCVNDEIAIGALKALREAGLHVPNDISLIGFDDIDMIEHITPALTTVRVNKEALGINAVQQLLFLIQHPEALEATHMLEVELIKRDSVARGG